MIGIPSAINVNRSNNSYKGSDKMKDDQGLTLIEVIATVAILSIVIVLFLNLSAYTRLAEQKSDRTTEAQQLIENMMNEIRDEYKRNTTQTLNSLTTLLNSKIGQYRALYPQYSFYGQHQRAANQITLPRACNSPSASISSLFYIQPNSYILSITACWGN